MKVGRIKKCIWYIVPPSVCGYYHQKVDYVWPFTLSNSAAVPQFLTPRVRWGWGGWRLDWGSAVRGLAVGMGLWLVEAGLG